MLKGSSRARDAVITMSISQTARCSGHASCGAWVGLRTTAIVQAAAFEIADNALTGAFVELAGFEPATSSLRKMRANVGDQGF